MLLVAHCTPGNAKISWGNIISISCSLDIVKTLLKVFILIHFEILCLLRDAYSLIDNNGSTSWLDHCITTSSSQTVISNMHVINDVVCSDHFPLCLNIDCDMPTHIQ